MGDLLVELFAIDRSLTGAGVRGTLGALEDYIELPLKRHEVPTGTQVGDWTIPLEWRFERARLWQEGSDRIIFDTDEGDPVIQIVGYSAPVDTYVKINEKNPNVHVGPLEIPDAIPYVTACYAPGAWGVCLSRNQYEAFKGQKCKIQIEAKFLNASEGGSLTYADLVIPGETTQEIVLSSYICHPAELANNECSGPVVLAEVIKWWNQEPRRYTLRAIFAPETIGAIAYMADGLERMKSHTKAGYTLTCMGGPGLPLVQGGRQTTYAERIAVSAEEMRVRGWLHRVSDERQWCAPGVDLPWATLMKTHPTDDEYEHRYHTSADNLEFVTEGQLFESYTTVKAILKAIELDKPWTSTVLGEPMLSKRGLYDAISKKGSSAPSRALLDTLSYCDGRTTLEIAETLGRPFGHIAYELEVLEKHGLIRSGAYKAPIYPDYGLMLEYWDKEAD